MSESVSNCSSNSSELSFSFRGKEVPVTHPPSIARSDAIAAVQSSIFQNWYTRCEKPDPNDGRYIDIHSVEIQSVDMFGSRGVGFVKIKAHCTLPGDDQRLPGICFLRGDGVTILVALFCQDDGSVYSLLVDQARVPIGQVSSWELPAGMLDNENETVAGIAVQEMREECGIDVKPTDMVDLTTLACNDAVELGHLPIAGIPPSPGGCDEFIRYMYMEKKVTTAELDEMRGRLAGLREHGEKISLRLVPLEDVWRVSGDAKAMICLFLLQELRKQGKIPPPGALATPLKCSSCPSPSTEPVLHLNTKATIPQLAFGLFKIPDSDDGERIISDAIAAGYRHFDAASIYGNEATLGRALGKSQIARPEFFITGKVWNDAVKKGRDAIRASVETSLRDIGCAYFDLYMIHWPVPGHFVDAYKELEALHREGKLRALGLSNFTPRDYEELVESGISIPPAVNQIEVSPVMYRKDHVDYFQERNIVVYAHKALNRGAVLHRRPFVDLADKYLVSSAQIMIRWGFQKGLVMATKTSNPSRMCENRSIMEFSLDAEEMALLDSLTTEKDIKKREELENTRKTSD